MEVYCGTLVVSCEKSSGVVGGGRQEGGKSGRIESREELGGDGRGWILITRR